MVGGTKLPPQDSESGPWLNEHKAKARATPRATPKPKPSSKGKRKTFRLVHVSLDNADTVIEGGPLLTAQTGGAPFLAFFARSGPLHCQQSGRPLLEHREKRGNPSSIVP